MEDLLKSIDFFDGSSKSQVVWMKLKEVLTKLIQSKVFFNDIAPENFIYDGNSFYMIDLRPFRICADVEEARKAYTSEILNKINDGIAWTQSRWYQNNHEEDKAEIC